MKIKNPLESDVQIVIRGVKYSIPAGSVAEIEDSVAAEWKTTHEFLEVVEKEEVKEVKEVKEEVKEEAPVSKKGKK